MTVFDGWIVTSPYGYRNDPFTGEKLFHTGIDLVKRHKYPIPAFIGGTILFAGEGESGTGFGGFGNVVAVQDIRGHVHCYCHLDSVAVQEGEVIMKSDVVGCQGTTGRSTGSHLHYEVRSRDAPGYGYGNHIDPVPYLETYYEWEDEEMVREEVGQLREQLVLISGSVDTLQEQIKVLEQNAAPEWFVKEFGTSNPEGVLNDTKGSYDFWRNLAVTLRILERKG